jgi:hypothetical protein
MENFFQVIHAIQKTEGIDLERFAPPCINGAKADILCEAQRPNRQPVSLSTHRPHAARQRRVRIRLCRTTNAPALPRMLSFAAMSLKMG